MDVYATNSFMPSTGAIAAVIAVLAVLLLIDRIATGFICRKLLHQKGHHGHFWMGFFLGKLGLIYAISVPDLVMRRYVKNAAKPQRPGEENGAER